MLSPTVRRWLGLGRHRLQVVLRRWFGFRGVRPVRGAPGGGITPDRYYIEAFLSKHAADVCGRVLECRDRRYTERYGGMNVSKSDVLNVESDHPLSTYVGDLAGTNDLPSATFDCIILTEVLQYIYDLDAAVATVARALTPGGVVLVTAPGLTPVHVDQWPWMWMLTTKSAERLFQKHFPSSSVTVESYGNVFAATAFLHGLNLEDVAIRKLAYNDPSFAVTVAVRAVKADMASTQ